MSTAITGEIVKSAISLKLKHDFVDSALPNTIIPKIYKEKIVQGMTKPCFFIWTMDVTQTRQFGNYYIRNYQVNVRFHPDDSDPKTYETLCDYGNRMLESLSSINIGSYPVNGKEMSFNIVEDILQVYVTYSIRITKQLDDEPLMETLDIINN